MRYLVISDVHSNIEALEAVLAESRGLGYDRAVCLGDLVGYGASPNEVVERVRELAPILIRGNHDKVISGADSGEQFNLLAAQSCQWTRETLSAENLEWLASLPEGPKEVDGEFWIAHGTPLDEDAYVLNEFDAIEVFRAFEGGLCFFGHSHIPSLFGVDREEGFFLLGPLGDVERFALQPGTRYLLNCGSVGQPRDRNPMAAYGLYDSERRLLEFRRVPYAVAQAQRRILETELPRFLAERLGAGV